ncbi:MAG: alpha/beta hydrolase [Bacteroidia bacterium]|nr:alpha/beta hydrolase [Bacteroidia bacterium]
MISFQPPVLLLHGALGSAAQMAPLQALFAPDMQAHTLNFSGHGGRPAAGPYQIEQFVRDTLAYLDEEGIAVCDIVGYSMGGYVALALAFLAPARVRRIVTLGTKFDWRPETAAAETRMLQPEVVAAKVPRFAALLAERHAPLDWKQVMLETARMLADLGDGGALPRACFELIPHPTLLMLGDRDQMVTLAETQTIADSLPQGHVYQVPDTPHPFEQVDVGRIYDPIWVFLTAEA